MLDVLDDELVLGVVGRGGMSRKHKKKRGKRLLQKNARICLPHALDFPTILSHVNRQ